MADEANVVNLQMSRNAAQPTRGAGSKARHATWTGITRTRSDRLLQTQEA